LSRLHALDFFSVVTFLFCWWCWDWTRVLEHVLYHWATSRPMVFGDRLLLCSPGWPQVLDPPASAFWVLWLQVWTATPICSNFSIQPVLSYSSHHLCSTVSCLEDFESLLNSCPSPCWLRFGLPCPSLLDSAAWHAVLFRLLPKPLTIMNKAAKHPWLLWNNSQQSSYKISLGAHQLMKG
jgi:hypothetical protein